MNSTIGIMGCGWMGLPLAKTMLANGYSVHGTTTSPEKMAVLEQEEIVPYSITLSEDKISGLFYDFLNQINTLVINIPPKLRSPQSGNYVKKMELICSAMTKSQVDKIIFVSSTSVYGEALGIVTEETIPRPVTESGRQLLISENLFRNASGFQTTVIRFGGLIGSKRHPVTLLSGKKELPNGNHPINLIHLNDCITIISSVIEQGWWNELFNAVYPYHPPKKEYYSQEAMKRGLVPPKYTSDFIGKGKKIDSHRLIHVKNYVFNTPIQG